MNRAADWVALRRGVVACAPTGAALAVVPPVAEGFGPVGRWVGTAASWWSTPSIWWMLGALLVAACVLRRRRPERAAGQVGETRQHHAALA